MILDLPNIGPVQFRDDLTEEQLNAQLQQLSAKFGFEIPKGELTTGEMASRAFTRGTKRLGSTFGDVIPAMGAKALGFDEYAQKQLGEAAETEKEIAKYYAPEYESTKNIKGITDLPGFALETIVEQIPNIATSLIPGVGVGAIAARTGLTAVGKSLMMQGAERGLAGEALTQYVAQGMAQNAATRQAVGQGAGAFLGSYAQNAPEIFQNVYQATGKMDVPASLLFGAGSAALDSILPAQLAKSLTGPAKVGIVENILGKSGMDPSLLRSVSAGVLKGMGVEGLTEGAQEAIGISAEKFVGQNPQIFESADWNRIMESSIRGAIAGSAFGGVGGVGARVQEKREEFVAEQQRQAEEQRQELARQVREAGLTIDEFNALQKQGVLPGMETGMYTQLLEPRAKEEAAKELKGKQLSLFDEQGVPTKVAEASKVKGDKAEAVRIRQLEQREAAALKATQEKLKKFFKAKQGELDLQEAPPFGGVAVEGQPDLFGAPAATTEPTVRPKPGKLTPQQVSTKIDDNVLGSLGIGSTALIRKNKLLDGMDISNPAEAAEVRRILEAYADRKNLSTSIREKVEQYLNRPEFQAQEVLSEPTISEPARPVGGDVQPSVPGIEQQLAAKPAAAGITEPVPAGLGITGGAVEPATTGEAPVNRPLGRKEKADVAKAEAAIEPAIEEKIKFIEQSDDNVLSMMEKQLPKGADTTGLEDTDAFRLFRVVPLIQEYNSLKQIVAKSGETKQRAKNAQELAILRNAIENSSPQGAQLVEVLDQATAREVEKFIDAANREARNAFTPEIQRRAANIDPAEVARLEKEAAAEAQLEALTNEVAEKFNIITGKKFFLPTYVGKDLDATGKQFVENNDLPGLISHLASTTTNPDVKQILNKIKGLNLKTKLVVGSPTGELAMYVGEKAEEYKWGLGAAQDLTKKGATPQQVWNETQWFKGPDGKWRFELDDSGAYLRPLHGENISALESIGPRSEFGWTVGDVLDHPKLFEAYPQLANVKVTRNPGFFDAFGLTQGAFYEDKNTINITPYAKDPLSTLLHEVQHWVQAREGFASGGNEDSVRLDNLDALKKVEISLKELIQNNPELEKSEDLKERVKFIAAKNALKATSNLIANNNEVSRLYKALDVQQSLVDLAEHKYTATDRAIKNVDTASRQGYNEWSALNKNAAELRKEISRLNKEVRATKENIDKTIKSFVGFENVKHVIYEHIAGEVEARDVQRRRQFDAAMRGQTLPGSSIEIRPENQILLRKEGETKAGSYDPATNTIALDPKLGLNEHTVIHELVHAAISHVLRNPNHPLTKEITKLYEGTYNQLGSSYGALDIQEFAAELVGNPEFQATLKALKAPRSGNMFQRMMQAVAEFFGFRKAYDKGIKLVSDIVDISSDIEPTLGNKMFHTMGSTVNQAFEAVGDIGRNMPELTTRAAENVRNTFSNLQDSGLIKAGMGMLRLDNLNTIYNKELPSIQNLIDALEQRNGRQEQDIVQINEQYKRFSKAVQADPKAAERMNNMAVDARLAQVDPLDPNFKTTPTNVAAYNKLRREFLSLPKDLQNTYREIRQSYTDAIEKYEELLLSAASPSLQKKLKAEFETRKRLVAYIPFLRRGDYWIEYADPATGERTVQAFESDRERDAYITKDLPKGTDVRKYKNLQDIRFIPSNVPPTTFIGRVIRELQAEGASQDMLNSVYQSYLALMPAESISKRFMKSDDVLGMERDIVRGFGDTMIKWTRKLADSEFAPKIDQAINAIQGEARANGSSDVIAAAENITSQSEFFHNPTYGKVVSGVTAFSYFEYIAGNISSALINLTSLPMFAWPILGAKFGFDKASGAMLSASKVVTNGIEKDPRYKKLYQMLKDHGQLEHTMAREVLESRRMTTGEYLGIKARILDTLSYPFSATERYNRGVTAVAAYDLARGMGMSDEAASRYAINTVKDINTSGMAVTAPKYMQHPLGRVFFTFKSFVWNSAFIVARSFHQAFKGESPEVRRMARRQLIGIYGMAGAFAGVKGLPFFGFAETLAQMINALFGDDDEPYNFDEDMREFFGELLYKGPTNFLTNLEIANRTGVAQDLIFRDDPRSIAEHGYVLSAMRNAFGPAGSYAVNAENAIKMMGEGHTGRSIEALSPSWMRNGMKGMRYMSEGALTLKGDPVEEDISAYNAMMQIIGFSPASLSSTYEKTSAAKGYEKAVATRKQQLLNKYDMARHAGDMDLLGDVREDIANFNSKHPANRITETTLLKSKKAREAAEKNMINGVTFNKKMKGEIQEKFFSDED
jgi:hypothetical protein